MTRKTGPESRIQQSSTGIEVITVTVDPHFVRAATAADSLVAHMMTGSDLAISLAHLATSSWIRPSRLPQIDVLEGQAIQVRLCSRSSDGTRKVAGAAVAPQASAGRLEVAAKTPAAVNPARAKNDLAC